MTTHIDQRGDRPAAVAPSFSGPHHFAFTVKDLDASVAWYQKVFRDINNIQLEMIATGV
ncbi:VOC family protein [Streptosporangium sp. NPDC002721]|uniref:VOC family protein n=1 Tax=Streptosporangium sp. NPDC002721 TaxID=3366188 RepID=UPI00367B2819